MVTPFSARWSLGVRSPKCCCHPAGSSWTLFPTIARKPRAERACPPSALSYRGRPPRTTGIPILGAFPGYLEKNQQLWQKLVNVCNVGNVKSFSDPVDKPYRDRAKAGNKESTGTYMHRWPREDILQLTRSPILYLSSCQRLKRSLETWSLQLAKKLSSMFPALTFLCCACFILGPLLL